MVLKFYAGIGSRKTPNNIQELMTRIAIGLESLHYILRSGGAEGADKAFQKGAIYSEIFKSKDAQPWSFDEIKKFIPNDRQNFDSWQPYIKGLLARNMMQILGKDGKQPVEFVVCWTPSLEYSDSSSGGTGYAIRCALHYNIPVYNLFDEKQLNNFKEKFQFIRF